MYLITRDSLSGDLELKSGGGLGEQNVKKAEPWQEQRVRPPSICKDHQADEHSAVPEGRGQRAADLHFLQLPVLPGRCTKEKSLHPKAYL